MKISPLCSSLRYQWNKMLDTCIGLTDFISIVLIFIEIHCCPNLTGLEHLQLVDIARILFGWKSDIDCSSLRIQITKWILIPRFLFGILACLGEFILLWHDHASALSEYPVIVCVEIALFCLTGLFTICLIHVACCTSLFSNENTYLVFLLTYRVLDVILNGILVVLEIEYHFKPFNCDNIIQNVLFVYSCWELFTCAILSIRTFYFCCRKC